MISFIERVNKLKKAIEETEYVLIGGGACLSAAAGLEYSGARFENNFKEFTDKYLFTDMYSATSYPFETKEEKWAYFAKHIQFDRFDEPPTKLYKDIYTLIKKKDYFVITTNVDSHFEKAGFEKERIFEVQGNYANLQCSKGCHKKIYYSEDLFTQMVKETKNCKIPTALIPKCPICGQSMVINLRLSCRR